MKNNIKLTNVAVLLTALFTLLSFTGCVHNGANVPVAKVEKNFKTSFASSELKDSVMLAAEANDWHVVNDLGSNKVELKKVFTKVKKEIGSRRWKKIKTNYDVFITVSMDSNSLNIVPLESSAEKIEKYGHINQFNKDLSHLEAEIYNNLVRHAL